MSKASPTRAGVIAVIGAPNAGKSTLVNRIVGAQVSIVTHKVQTTRFQVRGVAMRDQTQLVLIDTPGIFRPRRRLDRAMVRAAWAGASDADAALHVVDAPAYARALEGAGEGADARAFDDVAAIVKGLCADQRQVILVLNKVDAMRRDRLLAVAQSLHETGAYERVFMVSAAKGDGVEDLVAMLVERAPEGPFLYDPEDITDLPLRVLASEITREKLFLRLHDEIPYEATVETERWQDHKDGGVRIEQTILVGRESHRAIALGHNGQTLKAIGQAARAAIGETIGRPVHLFLHVKVDETWSEQPARYARHGLEFDS